MYANSAYWNNSLVDHMDKDHALFVSSCGTYRLISKPILPTHRPKGRVDYQLIYIAAGKGHFYIQDKMSRGSGRRKKEAKEVILPTGNMILYRPKEEQRYYYYGEDHTEVYWVHFTGKNVGNILREYGIDRDQHILHTGCAMEYKIIFDEMIKELKLKRVNSEELLAYYLRMLLIFVQRARQELSGTRNNELKATMDRAVNYFSQHYQENIVIEDYAKSLHMSVSWFIRNFREYTGTTPAKYITSQRIYCAQDLLNTTDLSISETSEISGYEDPLYFSRIFRKSCGISPRAFREANA